VGLSARYQKLSFWNKLGAWGAVASIVGIPVALLLARGGETVLMPAPGLASPPVRRAPAQVIGPVPDSLVDLVADSLATAQGVRPIAPLETGRSDTPPGTYSWTYVGYVALAAGRDRADRAFGGAAPRDLVNHEIRVHHLGDGTRMLLCFVSAEASAALARGESVLPYEITAFPRPWDEFRHLILLRWDRVATASHRTITLPSGQTRSVLEITVE